MPEGPEVVRRVEKDLQNIMDGRTAQNMDILLCCYSRSIYGPITIPFLEKAESNKRMRRRLVPYSTGKSMLSVSYERFDSTIC
ncbi:hypothetical protein OROHE_022619 [Orobanche hederae]